MSRKDFEGAIEASKKTAVQKIMYEADRIRQNGYTQPCAITFTTFEVRALARMIRPSTGDKP